MCVEAVVGWKEVKCEALGIQSLRDWDGDRVTRDIRRFLEHQVSRGPRRVGFRVPLSAPCLPVVVYQPLGGWRCERPKNLSVHR